MNRAQGTQFSVYQSLDDGQESRRGSRVSQSGMDEMNPPLTSPFKVIKAQNGRHSLLNIGENESSFKPSLSTQFSQFASQQDARDFQRPVSVIKGQTIGSRAPEMTQFQPFEDGNNGLHSNISPLHRLVLNYQFGNQSENKSASPIVEIFNHQQQEYSKVLEQMLTLKDQNAKLVDLLNEQHICMDQLIDIYSRIDSDLNLRTLLPSYQSQQQSKNLNNGRRTQRSNSNNARSDKWISHQEIIECVDQSKLMHEKVQRFLTELDISDLRCLSALKKLYQKRGQQSQGDEGNRDSFFDIIRKGQPFYQKSKTVDKRALSGFRSFDHQFGNIKNDSDMQEECEQDQQESEQEDDDMQEEEEEEELEQKFVPPQKLKVKQQHQDSQKNEGSSKDIIIISQDLPDDDDENLDQEDSLDVDEDFEEEEDKDDNYTYTKEKKAEKKPTQKKRGYNQKVFNTNKKTLKAIAKKPIQKLRKVAKEKFNCNKCGEVFQSGWALGGHASRVHPGESDSYRRKIQRREERVQERQLLSMAKQKHFDLYGVDTPINRVKIRKFKKDLKRTLFGHSFSCSKARSNSD